MINSVVRSLFRGGIVGLACFAVAPQLAILKVVTEASKSLSDEYNGGGQVSHDPQQQAEQHAQQCAEHQSQNQVASQDPRASQVASA